MRKRHLNIMIVLSVMTIFLISCVSSDFKTTTALQEEMDKRLDYKKEIFIEDEPECEDHNYVMRCDKNYHWQECVNCNIPSGEKTVHQSQEKNLKIGMTLIDGNLYFFEEHTCECYYIIKTVYIPADTADIAE